MQNTPVSVMPDTTSKQDDFLVEMVCPFTNEVVGLSTKQAEAEWEDRRERVRRHCVAAYSSSLLYQAMAEKDPTYWDNFSVGGINI